MSTLLADFICSHEHIFVLTGAGVSTASGIPEYRDDSGEWKHQKPMEYRNFVGRQEARQRYWTRSFIGWQRFCRAQPNAAHLALARLERLGLLARTVTQNVDGLHQNAGSCEVTELHGSLATVTCLDCNDASPRSLIQQRLLALNPMLMELSAQPAPDGDACLEDYDESGLRVPECENCGGILKPQVVFFGETVPVVTVQECFAALGKADAMLVIGSSLMVYSGYRFVREVHRMGIPIAAINRGKTRADELLMLKIRQDCGSTLDQALLRIEPEFIQYD
ncbi:MAG: NAD-dependent protein deacetylase [Gammaproteobacteria bacterium]|nr:NAD-dependent protein deacetylase [Gammaproteobacteria bacterium]